jgi:hypothetical protein
MYRGSSVNALIEWAWLESAISDDEQADLLAELAALRAAAEEGKRYKEAVLQIQVIIIRDIEPLERFGLIRAAIEAAKEE